MTIFMRRGANAAPQNNNDEPKPEVKPNITSLVISLYSSIVFSPQKIYNIPFKTKTALKLQQGRAAILKTERNTKDTKPS
jgi:hypothetical protein